MGNFDLYGNSYPTAREALNAEMAQCAEIDARIADERISKLENQLSKFENQQRNEYETEQRMEYDRDQTIDYLMDKVQMLEEKVIELEKRVGKHEA